jgi:hypothetical protein
MMYPIIPPKEFDLGNDIHLSNSFDSYLQRQSINSQTVGMAFRSDLKKPHRDVNPMKKNYRNYRNFGKVPAYARGEELTKIRQNPTSWEEDFLKSYGIRAGAAFHAGVGGLAYPVHAIDSQSLKGLRALKKDLAPAGRVDGLWIPRSHQNVVIKLSGYLSRNNNERRAQDRWQEAHVEAHMLQHLQTSSVKHPIQSCLGTLSAAQVVPRLWFAGFHPTKYLYVIVESLAPGYLLENELYNKKSVSPMLFAAFERAVLLMWSQGVSHMDLHFRNIIINPRGKNKVTILDFGRATKLSPQAVKQVHAEIRRLLRGTADVNSLWYNRERDGGLGLIGKEAHAWTSERGFTRVHSTGRVLRFLFNLVSDKDAIQAARAKVWRCGNTNCSDQHMLNPATGRCVQIRGRIGRRLQSRT